MVPLTEIIRQNKKKMMSFQESRFKINKGKIGCLSGLPIFWIQDFLFWLSEGQSLDCKCWAVQ